MWNPLLELLFHEQVSGIFEPFVDENDLAKVALSCHFALDLLCYKEGTYDSTWGLSMECICYGVAPLPPM